MTKQIYSEEALQKFEKWLELMPMETANFVSVQIFWDREDENMVTSKNVGEFHLISPQDATNFTLKAMQNMSENLQQTLMNPIIEGD